MTEKLTVAIVSGGPSSEHEVSLKSGAAVLAQINRELYNPLPVTITKDNKWRFPNNKELEEEEGVEELKKRQVAVVFNALHGEYGEDGAIQEMLTTAGIPFTGSKAYVSALGMNKAASAAVFVKNDLTVPKFITPTRLWTFANIKEALDAAGIRAPYVIKPLNRGSSVGVKIGLKDDELRENVTKALVERNVIIVQEYVKGREVTCGVLDTEPGKPQALPPTEIIPQTSEFFDYEAKYKPGASKEITPPDLPPETIKKIQETALKAHRALGCSGISRTDMILREDGELFVLELNTLPGLTETSLIPQEAKAAGTSFPKLIDILIHSAR